MKIHLDLDCYFVSAERTRRPFLKNQCVVVAKSSDKKIFSKEKKRGTLFEDTGAFNSLLEFPNRFCKNLQQAWRDEFVDEQGAVHGIVIAKSYEAKKYGIQTGTSLKEALVLCPKLYIVPSDHLFYQQLSQKLKCFLQSKIPLLEQYSIDEFFGDLHGWIPDENTLEFIANLQEEILKTFDLPMTIGASTSKWIAKLVTDKIKPYGVKVVPKDEILKFTKDIHVKDFPGIGKALRKKCESYQIHTLDQLQNSPRLLKPYGKMGETLYKRICGVDEESVCAKNDRRGVGISRNFLPISDRVEIRRRTVILARYLSYNIIKLEVYPTRFYFKIRYEHKIKYSKTVTKDRLFSEKFFINLALQTIHELDVHPHYKIHYIGINASNFVNKVNLKSFCLLEFEQDRKNLQLSKTMTQIRDKYGIDIIRYASES